VGNIPSHTSLAMIFCFFSSLKRQNDIYSFKLIEYIRYKHR